MPRKQAKEDTPSEERCLNRLAPIHTIRLFGDGIHKFFMEERCTNRRMEDRPICMPCSMPNTSIKQYARTFPRGLVCQPLPPDVHLFDSEWYHQTAKKWGYPPEETVMEARQYQQKARQGFHPKVQEPLQTEPTDMPRKSAITSSDPPKRISKLRRKKTDVEQPQEEPQEQPKEEPQEEPKEQPKEEKKGLTISEEIPLTSTLKVRRPRAKKKLAEPLPPMEPFSSSSTDSNTHIIQPNQPEEQPKEEQPQEEKQGQPKKPRARRAPAKSKKKESDMPVHPLSSFHRDSCIPTYLEEKMEELSISDYETETIPLSIFVLDNVTYFRDAQKNKLYRRIKEKTIGAYVGRYDPGSDSLVTDIPDSDDES